MVRCKLHQQALGINVSSAFGARLFLQLAQWAHPIILSPYSYEVFSEYGLFFFFFIKKK